MNRQEFEAKLQGRILNPANVVQMNSYFQIRYTPDDMVQVMTSGSNAQYYLNKEAAGLGTSKYSTNTLTLGYIYTVVSDTETKTTGGDGMSDPIQAIKDFFAAHHTIRKMTKQFIIGVASLISTISMANIGALDGSNYAYMIPVLMMIFNGIDNWAKHNPSLPIVGAKGKA